MVKSQFGYCLLICSKTGMQRVEEVKYKTLQVVFNNYIAIYYELIALDNQGCPR